MILEKDETHLQIASSTLNVTANSTLNNWNIFCSASNILDEEVNSSNIYFNISCKFYIWFWFFKRLHVECPNQKAGNKYDFHRQSFNLTFRRSITWRVFKLLTYNMNYEVGRNYKTAIRNDNYIFKFTFAITSPPLIWF
jgi:hypothetical protein